MIFRKVQQKKIKKDLVKTLQKVNPRLSQLKCFTYPKFKSNLFNFYLAKLFIEHKSKQFTDKLEIFSHVCSCNSLENRNDHTYTIFLDIHLLIDSMGETLCAVLAKTRSTKFNMLSANKVQNSFYYIISRWRQNPSRPPDFFT